MALYDVALGALVVLLATSAGSAVVMLFGCFGRRGYSAMLAFSAGAMAFSSVEMLSQSHQQSGDAAMVAGLLIGMLALMEAEKIIPHIHMRIRRKRLEHSKKKALLIGGSIALHNIPEGFAVASAFASSTPLGWFVTTAMALQDVPEGVLVSAPLACYGMGKKRSMVFGIFSGIVEAASMVLGFMFISQFAALIPFSLAFSAGAMIYVVAVELLPDAYRNGMERVAAVSFIAGAAMTFLIATTLGV